MAVIFSKHGGLNDEAWKTIDTELSMVIQDTDTEKNKDDELDDEVLVAILTAAVAAYAPQSAGKFRVVSFRRRP